MSNPLFACILTLLQNIDFSNDQISCTWCVCVCSFVNAARQGIVYQKEFILFSHLVPLHALGHLQVYVSGPLVQSPLCRHGLLLQEFISKKE